MVALALAAGRGAVCGALQLPEMTFTAPSGRKIMARHRALAREFSGQTEYGVDRDVTAKSQQGGEKDAPEMRL